jgi:hypothetical protein
MGILSVLTENLEINWLKSAEFTRPLVHSVRAVRVFLFILGPVIEVSSF